MCTPADRIQQSSHKAVHVSNISCEDQEQSMTFPQANSLLISLQLALHEVYVALASVSFHSKGLGSNCHASRNSADTHAAYATTGASPSCVISALGLRKGLGGAKGPSGDCSPPLGRVPLKCQDPPEAPPPVCAWAGRIAGHRSGAVAAASLPMHSCLSLPHAHLYMQYQTWSTP